MIDRKNPKPYFVRHRRIHNLEKEDGVLFSDEWTPIPPTNLDKQHHLIVELQNIHTNL